MLTLQKTESIHDSLNIPKIEFISYIYIDYKYIKYKNIYNLGNNTVLFLICNSINGVVGVKWKRGTASVNMDSQQSKQEACLTSETQEWLTVNHNTSIISGELI